MKKIFLVTMFLILIKLLISQELPLELFTDVEECYVKTHRILPEYDLKRTYIVTKNFYKFDNEGRIEEIQSYGGNNSYQGYYTYSYSDSLDVRTFYSTHNVITERFTTKYLENHGDTEETLYAWGGRLLRRVISTTDPNTNISTYNYYNDAGYPLYTDVKYKYPDGRIEKIITNDYDGFPVYFDYFYYDDNNNIESQRKVDYLDTLITVVEYDYDDNNNLIKKATIDFKTNKSIVENFEYDILNRLTLETVFEKSDDFGGVEELVLKREIYYEGYEEIDDEFYRGDDAKDKLQAQLAEKAERDAKRLAKLKAKQDREREKAEKKERKKLEKENMLLEERDVYKLEESDNDQDDSSKDSQEEGSTSQE